jgi:hypothetical protein
MTREYRLDARLDLVMSVMALAGVGVAVLVPVILIFLSTLYSVPNLDQLVIACQLGGCIMIGVGLGYFICRKEM